MAKKNMSCFYSMRKSLICKRLSMEISKFALGMRQLMPEAY